MIIKEEDNLKNKWIKRIKMYFDITLIFSMKCRVRSSRGIILEMMLNKKLWDFMSVTDKHFELITFYKFTLYRYLWTVLKQCMRCPR